MEAEDSASVDGRQWDRGQAIKRRRLAAGIKSLREFGRETGVSRGTVIRAEDGFASDGTYERLESWLDRFEEETGDDVPTTPEPEQMEVTIEGDLGPRVTRITTKYPVDNPELLERIVAAVIRGSEASDHPEG